MRALIALCLLGACSRSAPMTREKLGAQLFDDTRLSEPAGQACSDCHVANVAFADPEEDRTSAGALRDRLGSRNAQPLLYSKFIPPLHRDGDRMIGGLFWDGRTPSLEEQVAGPMLNPLEMNNPNKAAIVEKVRAHHGAAFRAVFGKTAFDDVDQAFDHIAEAIAAFERTQALAPFSSKYDKYLAGEVSLEPNEARGLAIFEDPARGNCASCHPSRAENGKPLFTDFSYANLGVPAFADNPFYAMPHELNPDGAGFIDHGLAKTTGDPAHDGMFRVPTLRNVARTTPYGHNGYFRRLDEVIEFHAANAKRLPAEVPATIDRTKLAQFSPSKQDLADLVAFLRTLTDAGIER